MVIIYKKVDVRRFSDVISFKSFSFVLVVLIFFCMYKKGFICCWVWNYYFYS